MITSDYHVHSSFSSDSQSSMESMIEKAISLGFSRICFTDHMDYGYPVVEEGMDFIFDTDSYCKKIEQLKQQYQGKIKILRGIELGLKPSAKPQIDALLSNVSFDFIIGSSHLVDNFDPYRAEYWETRGEEEAIRDYFQTIIDNVNLFPQINVYGHLDYIIRYSKTKASTYSYERYKDILDPLLATLIKHGKGIEVNTAGLKYGLGFAHPHPDLIKRYLALGGTILTIGSDGHKPEHLAYGFETARGMLLNLGLTHYTVFEQQVPIEVPL